MFHGLGLKAVWILSPEKDDDLMSFRYTYRPGEQTCSVYLLEEY